MSLSDQKATWRTVLVVSGLPTRTDIHQLSRNAVINQQQAMRQGSRGAIAGKLGDVFGTGDEKRTTSILFILVRKPGELITILHPHGR